MLSLKNDRSPIEGIVWILALLIAVFDYWVSKELNFLIICGVLLLTLSHDRAVYYKSAFAILWPVLLLSLIGLLSGLIYLFDLTRDFYRDIFAFLGVTVYFIAGILLSKYVKGFDTLFKGFSIVVVLSSVMHIGQVVQNFGHFESLQHYRWATGMTNINEALLLSLFFACLFNKNMRDLIPRQPGFIRIMIAVILISFMLYFSRTMIIALIVLTFFLSDFINVRYFFSVRNRRLPYAALCIILLTFFSAFVFSLLPSNGYVVSLVEKFEQIPEEIFWDAKNSYVAALTDINSNWRGYEASQGYKKFSNGNDLQKLFGYGFGALVDLELSIRLAGKQYEKIPILHNGFVFLLIKCGLAGLICYLVFLYRIGFSKLKEFANKDIELYCLYQMLSGLSVVVLLNTFTMTGLFNPGNASIPILIGLIVGLIRRRELEITEKQENPLLVESSEKASYTAAEIKPANTLHPQKAS